MHRLAAIILPPFALAALPGVALAQIAQPSPQPRVDLPISVRPAERPGGAELTELRDSIRDGRDSGQFTRQQARRLRREAHVLEATADRYAQDGISVAEQREMQTRAIIARQQADAQRGVTYGPKN